MPWLFEQLKRVLAVISLTDKQRDDISASSDINSKKTEVEKPPMYYTSSSPNMHFVKHGEAKNTVLEILNGTYLSRSAGKKEVTQICCLKPLFPL